MLEATSLFTRRRAYATLPFVSRVVVDILALHERVVVTRRTMEKVELGIHGGDAVALDEEYREMMERLRELVRELDLVGVDIEDFEAGLVTFPMVDRQGDAVYAWLPGKPEEIVKIKRDRLCELLKKGTR